MLDKVTPGINPQLVTSHFDAQEKDIIRRFSQEWYITNGGSEINLNPTSTYRYFLMKPIDQYRDMFNIERELVVILSPYERFEPRTLDAIDFATRGFQTLRIERICSVIVSKDPQISSKLRDLLKNDQESQIIIPFSYDELKVNHDPYFIRNRFKSHFFTRDLFAFEAPLKRDLYFFGRNDLIHAIASRHRSNENSGLFGLRKTGKTSVVFGVERALSKVDGKSVFIDCQNPAFHRRRWNKALHYILSELIQQHHLNIKIEPEEKFSEEDAPILFERGIQNVYNRLGA